MLLQLEVEDDFLKIAVHKLRTALGARNALGGKFLPGQFPLQDGFALLGGSSTCDYLSYLLVQDFGVSFLVHFLDYLHPHPVFYPTSLDSLKHAHSIVLRLHRMFIFDHYLHKT